MPESLKEIFQKKDFIRGFELVCTRGLLQTEGKCTLDLADEVIKTNDFDFISSTDNAGGNPMIAPETVCKPLLAKNYNVNIHLTCKDRNRNALEMRLWQLASEGFNNILALTGDYPIDGFNGVAKPVFDIDSVVLIKMIKDMNNGLEIPGRKKDTIIKLSKTNFFVSACVSPFKQKEEEYLMQLFKMEKKIKAGVDFFILQLGYDSRKWAELLLYAKKHNITTPFIANIYILTKGVARLFNKQMIPGCNVSDKLLSIVEKQSTSPDKGKKFFAEFAAKQCAIAKGLGFKGIYLGGIHKIDTYYQIREIVNSFKENDWKEFYKEIQFPLEKEFYLYNTDDNSKLPIEEFNPKYKKSKNFFYRNLSKIFKLSPLYHFSRVMHFFIFKRKSPFYFLLRLFYKIIDGKKIFETFFHSIEHFFKFVMFGCNDCGDCSLMDVAYLCPMDKCSKNQRNGPCGGSRKGKCEVDDKICIWVKAYRRLKPFNKEKENFKHQIVITDAKLLNTSSWQNFYLRRDHLKFRDDI